MMALMHSCNASDVHVQVNYIVIGIFSKLHLSGHSFWSCIAKINSLIRTFICSYLGYTRLQCEKYPDTSSIQYSEKQLSNLSHMCASNFMHAFIASTA